MSESNAQLPTSRQSRIAELDGLRGIAIILVLLVHFGARIPPDSEFAVWMQAICISGWCGVDLFFVLSGFLITGILLETRGGSGYYHKFFARRVLRIFPLYYGVLLAAFVVLPAVAPSLEVRLRAHQGWLWLYASNFLSVVEGADPLRGEVLNFAHFWSLAIEEQFYLCWPLVVSAAGPRRLPVVCGALIALSPPLRWAMHSSVGPFAPYYFTLCRVDALAWGALGAVAVRTRSVEWIVPVARRLLIGAAIPLAVLFAARRGLPHYDLLVAVFGYSLLAVLFTGVVLTAHSRRESRFGACLRHGVLQELGRVSYGIYIFHGLLQVLLWRWAEPIAAAAGEYVTALIVYVTVCGGCSYVCALGSWPIETAFLRLKRYVDYGARVVDSSSPLDQGELVRSRC